MNRQITLAARPVGYPKESDFKLVETDIPTPEAGQVLIKTIYLSVDPYMRGRMNAARSYAANVEFTTRSWSVVLLHKLLNRNIPILRQAIL